MSFSSSGVDPCRYRLGPTRKLIAVGLARVVVQALPLSHAMTSHGAYPTDAEAALAKGVGSAKREAPDEPSASAAMRALRCEPIQIAWAVHRQNRAVVPAPKRKASELA
jgi:hypothetical protein